MILKNVSCPEDLKKIDKKYFPEVCQHIRDLIIETTSKNGGHIAPSLGVVELTVALHYVFDSPVDKIVWDVGHQAYAHKILTGRRDTFHTLRTLGGVSGFPARKESVHDAFGVGHASTSISAALGMAKAFKKEGNDNRAIAVIGDGSMTGGLAFEALNQAGHKTGNLIVVLNDNEMSISPNVGALSRFLSTSLHGKVVGRLRRHFKKLLLLIPIWGKKFYYIAQKAEESTVGFFTPGYMFEAFGFNYIGPLDGHNIEEMIEVFDNIKSSPVSDRPMLVHVITKKGKGYKPAEENPTSFHGIGAFDKQTGKAVADGGKSFTQAFSDSMCRLAKEDPSVVAITAAMSTGTGLDKFAKEYPDRFYDVGIAEGHAATFAAGLASVGLKPVVAIYSTFLQRAFDNIIHDVCLQNLPVTFVLDRAGLVGNDGATHHGGFDISYLRQIPRMTIMAPRNERLLDEMLKFSTSSGLPCAIRFPRGLLPEKMVEEVSALEPFKAEVVREAEKPDLTIWAVGNLLPDAIKAARELATEGILARVIDPRFIKPFDEKMLAECIKDVPRILTIEENVLAGGFGSMIGEWLAKENLFGVKLKSLGLPDEFVEHASQKELRSKHHLDVPAMVAAAKELVNNTGVVSLGKAHVDSTDQSVSNFQS